ncbi:unnamed protein product [Urochloa humidicola]
MRAHYSRLNRTSYYAAASTYASGKAAQRALHTAALAPDHRQRGGAPLGLGSLTEQQHFRRPLGESSGRACSSSPRRSGRPRRFRTAAAHSGGASTGWP